MKIDPEKDLISSGTLDSLALMQLIIFIEGKFGVPVADAEVIPDHFRTINLIKALIEQKQERIKAQAGDGGLAERAAGSTE